MVVRGRRPVAEGGGPIVDALEKSSKTFFGARALRQVYEDVFKTAAPRSPSGARVGTMLFRIMGSSLARRSARARTEERSDHPLDPTLVVGKEQTPNFLRACIPALSTVLPTSRTSGPVARATDAPTARRNFLRATVNASLVLYAIPLVHWWRLCGSEVKTVIGLACPVPRLPESAI